MKFNSLFRVRLIFTHTILRTSKSAIEAHHEKNATVTARLCLLQDVLRRLLFKQTAAEIQRGNHHLSFLRFELQKKMSMQPKFGGGAVKMLLKQKPSKHS